MCLLVLLQFCTIFLVNRLEWFRTCEVNPFNHDSQVSSTPFHIGQYAWQDHKLV